MAYVAGDTILDDEYNNFVDKSDTTFGYNIFAGTTAADSGNFDLGLGQTNISTVAATNTITAAQWNSVFTGITNIANHANISVTSAAAVSSGDAIAIKAALETDLGSLRTAIQGGCASATALTTSAALQTVTTASEGWDTSATQEVRVTFTNANQMRWFFNAGGKVRITVGTTQASVNPKDTAFIDLGTAIGNLDIGSKATTRSGTGEGLTTDGLALGFHDLTTAYQTILKLTSDNANYTSNAIEIQAKLDAAVGSSTVITVKMIATDPSSDEQFTSGNTSGIAVGIKDTPKMVTTLFTIDPNTSEGLATAYTPSSTATVSNTVV
jgi:hypothetical protein